MTDDNDTGTDVLFFTAKGYGPDSLSNLRTRPVAELRDGDEMVMPRTIGLLFDVAAPIYVESGGIQLTEAAVRKLVGEFQAWLDAPRLAARADAVTIAKEECDDVTYYLVRTPFEWGVGDDGNPEATWFAGPDAERDARALYATWLTAPPVLVESADGAVAATPIDDAPRFRVALLRDVANGAWVAPFRTEDMAHGAVALLAYGHVGTGYYGWLTVDSEMRAEEEDDTPCIVDTRPEVTP